MENLQQLLKSLKEEWDVKCIYWNDSLEDFDEFLEAFKDMNIEEVIQKDDLNIFYLLLSNGTWHKVSVYSLDGLEEEGL